MWRSVLDWVEAHEWVAGGAALLSVVLAVGTAVLLPWLIASMPRDFFLSERPLAPAWARRHPVLRWITRLLRNAVGAVLVLAGIAMLVLPGQGLLTIAVGVVLLQFPGKRRLELWFVRRRRVWRALNWVRRKMGKEAFDNAPPRV